MTSLQNDWAQHHRASRALPCVADLQRSCSSWSGPNDVLERISFQCDDLPMTSVVIEGAPAGKARSQKGARSLCKHGVSALRAKKGMCKRYICILAVYRWCKFPQAQL